MSFWIEMARKEKEKAQQRLDYAYSITPKEYHWFLIELKQNKKLGSPGSEIRKNSETYELGMWQNKNGDLYITIYEPYMSVDGRVMMARDEHKKAGKKLIFRPPVIGKGFISITVESELYGEATGTAKIGSGKGVDSTNPIENAETSAIGRALGFLGYGLFGNGIASAEEIISARADRKQSEKQPPKKDTKKTNVVNMRERISGKIADYKIQGEYLAVVLDTGEQVVFPSSYPAFVDSTPAKGASISIDVIRKGNSAFVAGITGSEIVIEETEVSSEAIPEEAMF